MLQWLLPWAAWLEQTAVGTTVRGSAWAYPAAEVGHLIGLGLVFGTAVAFDMRLLGAGAHLPVSALAGHLLPWARAGFVLMAATGALLFAANATTLLSFVLAVKLGAILVAVTNASLFHRGIFRSVPQWDVAPAATPWQAKAAAILSLVSWVTALVCGRLLAYV